MDVTEPGLHGSVVLVHDGSRRGGHSHRGGHSRGCSCKGGHSRGIRRCQVVIDFGDDLRRRELPGGGARQPKPHGVGQPSQQHRRGGNNNHTARAVTTAAKAATIAARATTTTARAATACKTGSRGEHDEGGRASGGKLRGTKHGTVVMHALRLSGGGDGGGRGLLRGAGDRDRRAWGHVCALDDARDMAGGKPGAARTDGRPNKVVRPKTHRGAM